MSNLLQKLKANWPNILLALIGLISSADAAVGLRGGKSPLNVTVIPSILAALGAGGTLGVKWLNGRTVVTRAVKQGLSPELWERLDNLFGLARDPDVSPEHASHLAAMAGDLLLAENRRAKLEQAKKENPVQVLNVPAPKFDLAIVDAIRKALNDGTWTVPPANNKPTNQETAR
jgi:hypothetical protein